ncbi:P-loop containing nucleoside triphosphate hydrolase protein [Hypoxylon sp. NC1633]|nr:P-loop containing nucleoside triphosphate hydrolase protein [Hypoxylon sp. NC1633]
MAAQAPAVSLQSKDHKTLMDIIDKLRSKGINRYVNLPQIVVCGDQSSGKSSVLQAISGLSFPTKDSLCTRFATELILRHTDEHAEEKCRVSIAPGPERSAAEKKRLEEFQYSEIPDRHNIGVLIEKAADVMGLGTDGGKAFGQDILRIELSGPAQPHLTIVDLPGLFRAGNKEQSAEDAATVQKLVRSYMKNPRSIILAVVSAQSNFALQEVTQLAREIDVRGVRTLGLITKPDTLDVGSASERDYFNLAQNRDVKFRLGWHVVRNRDFKTRNATNDERDQAEAEFFNQGVWAGLSRPQKGAASLCTRLSEVLKNQILDQLPDVLDEIQRGLEDCTSRLEKLGVARSTPTEQRKYLLNTSHQFSNLITEAKDGLYKDKFFGDARQEEGYQKRLRAVVQNTLTEFSHEMRTNGQSKKIIDKPMIVSASQISRSVYLDEVKDLMKRTRGCELPGTYNPLVIGELFREQCMPWRELLEDYSDRIFEAVDFTVNAALTHIVDDDTKAKLWSELINDALGELRHELREKLNEILRPYEEGHPITYNHSLTDTVQKIRVNRMRENIMRGLKESGVEGNQNPSMTIDQCLDAIMKYAEADMETVASSDAVDWVEAYYEVALQQVVDDFSTLAIEASLVSKLPRLFTPEIVFDLDQDVVSRIAAESWQTADERKFLTDKIEILGSGMNDLQRLRNHHRQVINVADDRETRTSDASSAGSRNIPTPEETRPEEVVESVKEGGPSLSSHAADRAKGPTPSTDSAPQARSPFKFPPVDPNDQNTAKERKQFNVPSFNFNPIRTHNSGSEPRSVLETAARPVSGKPTSIFAAPTTAPPTTSPLSAPTVDASRPFQARAFVFSK